MAASVPTSETGTAIIGMSAARQFWRKTSTTMKTSTIASNSVWTTSLTLARTKSVGSKTMSYSMPVGPVRVGAELLHLLLDVAGGAEGVAAGELEHRDADRRAVVQRAGRVVALGPEFDAGHIAEPHQRLALRPGLHHDVLELLLGLEPALRVDDQLPVLPARHRRLADLPGRHLHVLLADRVHHLGRHQVDVGHLLRVEPDPHGVVAVAEHGHVADAVEAGEFVLDRAGWRAG